MQVAGSKLINSSVQESVATFSLAQKREANELAICSPGSRSGASGCFDSIVVDKELRRKKGEAAIQ